MGVANEGKMPTTATGEGFDYLAACLEPHIFKLPPVSGFYCARLVCFCQDS